ncbi:MAG: hypothetical protein LBQ81_09330 [Zoogloeaceae bacterium]|nr:hypothetical protein [Zoogloeaceae bacterium]
MQKYIFMALIVVTLTACAEPVSENRPVTLEMHMVDDTPGALESALAGNVPDDTELYSDHDNLPLLVNKQVKITNAHLKDAQTDFSQNYEAAISISLNATGTRTFCELTRENIGKRVAVLLIEDGKLWGANMFGQ